MLKRISCIGNITDDTLLSVASLPELDDNAYVNKGIYCLGGRGGVVALTLAQMTENVELVTVLPDSEQAYAAQDFLGQHGVSLRGISTDYGARRMHSVIAALSTEDRNSISFFYPGDVRFDTTETQRHVVKESDVAYFSTHKRAFNLDLLGQVDTDKTTVIHNVASYLSSDEEYRTTMIEKSHVLICNEQESDALTAASDVDNVSLLFERSRVLRSVIVTEGEDGSIVYGRGTEPQRFGIERCEIVAPIGAGDSYAAGIVYGVANSWPVDRAVQLAIRLSALSVSSETSYPDLSKVQQTLHEVQA